MSNKLKNRSGKKKESLSTAFMEFFNYLLNGMISIYMLLIIAVMPFYNQEGFSHIGSDKASFFRNVSVNGARVILPTLAIFLVLKGIETYKEERLSSKKIWTALRESLSVTDVFALVYGLSVILSYLFTDYREQGTWGADGWYMGFWPKMILLGAYFLISKCWTGNKWIVAMFLPASAAVFLLGYLNRFGIFPIDMKVDNIYFLSTVGNINWYCGYLVSVFFGGCYLLLKSDMGQSKRRVFYQIILILYVAIGFSTLVTQSSHSGILALVAALVVMFFLAAEDGKCMQMFWMEVLIFFGVCMIVYWHRNILGGVITINNEIIDLLTNTMVPVFATVVSIVILMWLNYCNAKDKYPMRFFRVVKWLVVGGVIVGGGAVIGLIVLNTIIPGSIGALSQHPFFTYSLDWGSDRGATWSAGWMCFIEQNILHKLIGVGPDCMSAFIYQNGSMELVEMVKSTFGTSTLTNAHCEWLTILVDEGILGLIGFVGMMISAMVRFLCRGNWRSVIAGACGMCLLAYTVNNFVSFQQSMNMATIFVILGTGEMYSSKIKKRYSIPIGEMI